MVSGPVEQILQELKAGMQSIYGSRLQGLYLYGSYARGEQQHGSDFDVLVVLDDYESYAAEIQRTSTLVAHLSLRYEVTVSRVFLRQSEWLFGDNPFLGNVREEAIPA